VKRWEIEFDDWIKHEVPIMLKEWEGRLDHDVAIADLMKFRLDHGLCAIYHVFMEEDDNEVED